eukprot:5707717-Pyramimonas_sp.AAC.1
MVRFYKRPEIATGGEMNIRGRKARALAAPRPGHVLPGLWNIASKKERLAEKRVHQRRSPRARDAS